MVEGEANVVLGDTEPACCGPYSEDWYMAISVPDGEKYSFFRVMGGRREESRIGEVCSPSVMLRSEEMLEMRDSDELDDVSWSSFTIGISLR